MSKTNNAHKRNKELLIQYLTTNDKSAYDELFTSNVNLVRHFITKNVSKAGKNANELIEEYFDVGCLGLHKAIVTFKLEKINTIQFATYASICIRNEIYMEFRKEKKHSGELYLEDSIGNDTEDLKLEDTLADDTYRPDEVIEEKDYALYKKKKVSEAISKLNSKSRKVLELFYGFNGNEKKTVKQIAEILGVSKGYTNKILISIREYLKGELEEFDGDYRKVKKRHGSHRKWVDVLKEENIERKPKIKKKLGKRLQGINRLYLTYGKEKVITAIENFDDIDLKMLKLYFGVDGYEMEETSSIAKICNIEKNEASKLLTKNLRLLENILMNKKVIRKTSKFKDLCTLYGIDKVNEAIEKLTDRKKQMINLRHGESRNENVAIAKIAAQLNLDYSTVSNTLNGSYKEIERIILMPTNDKSLGKKKRKRVLFIEKYGKDTILEAISKLNETDQSILNLYFDGDGKSSKEIAIILGLDTKLASASLYNAMARLECKLLNSLSSKLAKKREEKLELIYDKYGKDQVNKAISILSDKQLQVVIAYYGLGDEEPISREEICNKFDITMDELTICLSEFNKLVKGKEAKVTEKVNRIEELYKQYGIDKVDNAFALLSEKMQNILKLYYGLDDEEPLTAKEVGKRLGYSTSNVTTTIGQAIEKLEKWILNPKDKRNDKLKQLDDLYVKYGKDKVLASVDELSDNAKKIITLYFGLDGGNPKTPIEISEILEFSPGKVYNILYKSFEQLEKNINKTNKYNVEDLYSKYGKENIMNLIGSLGKKRKVIELYYGIGADEPKSSREIATMLDMDPQNVSATICYFNKNIEKGISRLQKETKNSDDLINIYGKENLENAVNQLPKKRKMIMTLYYGLYGNKAVDISKIAETIDAKVSTVYSLIYASKKAIKNIFDNNSNKKSKLEKLYDKYGKEAVDTIFSKITKKSRTIIELYYGLDGKKELSGKEVASIVGVRAGNVTSITSNIVKRIEKSLQSNDSLTENKDVSYSQDVTLEEDAKKIIEVAKETSKAEGKSKKKSIYEKMCDEYGKDKVIEAISKLKDKHKSLYSLYYGVEVEAKSTKDIAQMFNMTPTNLSVTVFSINKKLKNMLSKVDEIKEEKEEEIKHEKIEEEIDLDKEVKEEKTESRKEELYSLLMVDDEEVIENAIARLSTRKQDIIKIYYGYPGYPMLSIEEISKKLNVDQFLLSLAIEQIIDNINSEIIDMQEEKLTNDELKLKRKKEFINSLLIKDKDMIKQTIRKLSIDEYSVISLYYGISNDVHTLNDIVRLTKLSKKRIKEVVRSTIDKINNMLIRKNKGGQ